MTDEFGDHISNEKVNHKKETISCANKAIIEMAQMVKSISEKNLKLEDDKADLIKIIEKGFGPDCLSDVWKSFCNSVGCWYEDMPSVREALEYGYKAQRAKINLLEDDNRLNTSTVNFLQETVANYEKDVEHLKEGITLYTKLWSDAENELDELRIENNSLRCCGNCSRSVMPKEENFFCRGCNRVGYGETDNWVKKG